VVDFIYRLCSFIHRRISMFVKRILLFGSLFMLSTIVQAQSLFDMPRLFPQHVTTLNQFLTAARKNDLIVAEAVALKGVELLPKDANWHYNVACVYARRQQFDLAIEWLEKAVDLGFGPAQAVFYDEDLKALHTHPGFAKIKTKLEDPMRVIPQNPTLRKATPSPLLQASDALVTTSNTQWEWHPVNGGYFTTQYLLPPTLTAKGTPLLYVNRDEDRTQPNCSAYPSVMPVMYGEEAIAARAHIAVANGVFMAGAEPIPTIGNSVLTIQRLPFWRTLPRFIATHPETMAIAYRLAFFNQLYFYDATIDVSSRFKGDILPSQHPFYITTADYGTSDKNAALQPDVAQQTLVEYALEATFAMPEATRKVMFEKRLLVWTMQRLFREAQRGAKDIFDPIAYPTAFDPKRMDREVLIQKAKALTPETLPPMFRILMLDEKQPVRYVDYFDETNSERFGDTSMSVSRIVRDLAYTRKMTLIANGEPGLTYHWFVVNGQSDKIRIQSLEAANTKVEIEVDWHGVYNNREGLPTRRVDIACVAQRADGTTSAPAFLSLRYLANEQRVYEHGRLISVDYRAPKTGLIFEDPALTAQKCWKDSYHYDANGTCTGWTRVSEDKPIGHFNARGERLAPDQNGKQTVAEMPSYTPRLSPRSDGISSPALELLEF
jgi:hypothetical protein